MIALDEINNVSEFNIDNGYELKDIEIKDEVKEEIVESVLGLEEHLQEQVDLNLDLNKKELISDIESEIEERDNEFLYEDLKSQNIIKEDVNEIINEELNEDKLETESQNLLDSLLKESDSDLDEEDYMINDSEERFDNNIPIKKSNYNDDIPEDLMNFHKPIKSKEILSQIDSNLINRYNSSLHSQSDSDLESHFKSRNSLSSTPINLNESRHSVNFSKSIETNSKKDTNNRKRKNNPSQTQIDSDSPKYMKYFKKSCQFYLKVFPNQTNSRSSSTSSVHPTRSKTPEKQLTSLDIQYLEESLRNAKISLILLLEQKHLFEGNQSFSNSSKLKFRKHHQIYIKSIISIQMHIVTVLTKLGRVEEAKTWAFQRDAIFELNQELIMYTFEDESSRAHSSLSKISLSSDLLTTNKKISEQIEENMMILDSESKELNASLRESQNANKSSTDFINGNIENFSSDPSFQMDNWEHQDMSIKNDDLSSISSIRAKPTESNITLEENTIQFLGLNQIYSLIYMSLGKKKSNFEYSPESKDSENNKNAKIILKELKSNKNRGITKSPAIFIDPNLPNSKIYLPHPKRKNITDKNQEEYNVHNRRVTLPSLNFSRIHKGQISDGALVAPSNMFPIFNRKGEKLKVKELPDLNTKSNTSRVAHSTLFEISKNSPSTGRNKRKNKKKKTKSTPQIAWGVNYDPATVYCDRDNLMDAFGSLHGLERFGKKLVLGSHQPKPPSNPKKNAAPRKKPTLPSIYPNNVDKSVFTGQKRIVSPSLMKSAEVQTDPIKKSNKDKKDKQEINIKNKLKTAFEFPMKKSKRFRLYRKQRMNKKNRPPEMLLSETQKKLRKYLKFYNTPQLNEYLTSEEQDAKTSVLCSILLIQSSWRKYKAKKFLKENKQKIKLVQAGCRSIIQQQKMINKKKSALIIQTNWRGFRHRIALIRFKASRTLQMSIQSYIARKKLYNLRKELQSAIKIQMAYRGFIASRILKNLYQRRDSALTIQCAYRVYVANRVTSQKRRENNAALVIQYAWNKFSYQKTKINASRTIQKAIKRYLFVKNLENSRFDRKQKIEKLRQEIQEQRDNAALIIQRVYRGYNDRKAIKKMNDSALIITKYMRNYTSRKFRSKINNNLKNEKIISRRLRAHTNAPIRNLKDRSSRRPLEHKIIRT